MISFSICFVFFFLNFAFIFFFCASSTIFIINKLLDYGCTLTGVRYPKRGVKNHYGMGIRNTVDMHVFSRWKMTKNADGQVITKKLMMLLVVACVADCSTPKSDSLRVIN